MNQKLINIYVYESYLNTDEWGKLGKAILHSDIST